MIKSVSPDEIAAELLTLPTWSSVKTSHEALALDIKYLVPKRFGKSKWKQEALIDILRLGVPPNYIPAVRDLVSPQEAEELLALFKKEQEINTRHLLAYGLGLEHKRVELNLTANQFVRATQLFSHKVLPSNGMFKLLSTVYETLGSKGVDITLAAFENFLEQALTTKNVTYMGYAEFLDQLAYDWTKFTQPSLKQDGVIAVEESTETNAIYSVEVLLRFLNILDIGVTHNIETSRLYSVLFVKKDIEYSWNNKNLDEAFILYSAHIDDLLNAKGSSMREIVHVVNGNWPNLTFSFEEFSSDYGMLDENEKTLAKTLLLESSLEFFEIINISKSLVKTNS